FRRVDAVLVRHILVNNQIVLEHRALINRNRIETAVYSAGIQPVGSHFQRVRAVGLGDIGDVVEFPLGGVGGDAGQRDIQVDRVAGGDHQVHLGVVGSGVVHMQADADVGADALQMFVDHIVDRLGLGNRAKVDIVVVDRRHFRRGAFPARFAGSRAGGRTAAAA